MSNKEISARLSFLAKLMDIRNLDPFRARSYNNAAFRIRQLATPLEEMTDAERRKIPGVGTAIAAHISELLDTGSLKALEELIETTPPGILEMARIKGIGSKKINTIWKVIGIESVEELAEAIEKNLLVGYPGFGTKTQQNIGEAVEFYLSQREFLLFSQAEAAGEELLEELRAVLPSSRIEITGDVRRHSEVVSTIEFVVAGIIKTVANDLTSAGFEVEQSSGLLQITHPGGAKAILHVANGADFERVLFDSTGPQHFTQTLLQKFPSTNIRSGTSEQEIFDSAGIQFIPACLRDTPDIISLARNHKIPRLIQTGDVQGLIHCHTTWSDGVNTVEQMAEGCIRRGLQYMVLSDHSKAAFYAQGLDEEKIRLQHQEVAELNSRLAPFKIFKSIECDILPDGSLDYDKSVWESFDLMIASIHSPLNMSSQKATERLIRAIENPYTSILGHMTGRLLLIRTGYAPDHKTVIDACVEHGVVIEINANPRRLDISWEWIPYALNKGAMLSINPDAHSVEEIDKIRYGVLAAQKGLLTRERNLSSFSLEEFEQFVQNRSPLRTR